MTVKNDRALDVALGNSRKTKTWKNKTLRWSELLERLKTTTRTPETMAEYRAIEELPSAQPTLYGYNIEHLELIARVLQKEDLPPERVVEALTDIGRIVAIVRDEFEETLRRAVQNIERRTDDLQ